MVSGNETELQELIESFPQAHFEVRVFLKIYSLRGDLEDVEVFEV